MKKQEMKQFLLFCLFFLAFFWKGQAQTVVKDSVGIKRPAQNAVYLELLGNAVIASVNYERLVYLPDNAPMLALRAGVLPMATRENTNTRYLHLFVPFEVTLIPSKKNISPEFGAGITLMNTYTKNKLEANYFELGVLPMVRAGLRWGIDD